MDNDMTLDESIELWQKEHEHEIVYACNMNVEVHEIVDRANPWRTELPQTPGDYLFEFGSDNETWYSVEYLSEERIRYMNTNNKWNNYLSWQKITKEK